MRHPTEKHTFSIGRDPKNASSRYAKARGLEVPQAMYPDAAARRQVATALPRRFAAMVALRVVPGVGEVRSCEAEVGTFKRRIQTTRK